MEYQVVTTKAGFTRKNPGTFRRQLAGRGVNIYGGYAADIWGNTTGGIRQGSVYNGLLKFGVNLDFQKLMDIPGLKFQTSWYWLSGKDASADLVGNIFTISDNAGFATLRVFELWAEQSLLNDKISIRVGQMEADTEFATSTFAYLFLNGTFGWPAYIYANIPNGGPGLPMSAIGVRITANPTVCTTVRSGVFQGNVFPQYVNRHGFDYNLDPSNGYLWLNEAEFRSSPFGLPATYKAGAWFDTANFAKPGNPAHEYPWNYGLYLIADQKLWTPTSDSVPLVSDGKSQPDKQIDPKGSPANNKGLGWFGRCAFSPQDRSFMEFYFDTGLAYTGLIPTRDNDQIGLAVAYGNLSPPQANVFLSRGSSNAGYELLLESTYSAIVNKWLSIQPDLQYVIHPGATGALGNALVVGCRASITF